MHGGNGLIAPLAGSPDSDEGISDSEGLVAPWHATLHNL
jgi:hypothetical protein